MAKPVDAMKKVAAYIWAHWWCRLPLALTVVFAIACLVDPYFRQSIFGPKPGGIPWCKWEESIRGGRTHNQSWWSKWMERLGVRDRRGDGALSLYELIYEAQYRDRSEPYAGIPVWAYLADDSDEVVRRDMLNALSWCAVTHGEETLPTLRRHLRDGDALCRAYAARGVWWGAQEATILPVILRLLGDPDREARSIAVTTLCHMAGQVPESFPHLVELYHGGEFKWEALRVMPRCGKRGVPIIRDALGDKGLWLTAIVCAGHLRQDGAELIPDLLALRQLHGHTYIDDALFLIDPERFPLKKN